MSALLLLVLQADFLQRHCLDCHDADTAEGGLDLSSLTLEDSTAPLWIRIHDRARDGEMPPRGRSRPERAELDAFLRELAAPLAALDRAREVEEGRSTWRRLSRDELENSIRDLLQAPWLRIKDRLPEDGEAHRFAKSGEALDVSYVHMAGLLDAAEHALRSVVEDRAERPPTTTSRHLARDMRSFSGRLNFAGTWRSTFRVGGDMGVLASSYHPLEIRFDAFRAPRSGRYRLRLSASSIWVGPGPGPAWWRPDLSAVSRGRRSEPITLYAERPPTGLRRLGAFDALPDPTVGEWEVDLLEGETIRPDASRLFRSRPPAWRNPLAQPDGQPGVAFAWLEVEGPLLESWPPAGHRLLFGDPETEDVDRLLRAFLAKAYRLPASESDVALFRGVIGRAQSSGSPFRESLLAGYAAVLCSPRFACLEERPGPLGSPELAARLSYFLWNSPPDAALRAADLRDPELLRAQTERLLDDPKSRRFVDAFLDSWLDLRRLHATTPDAALFPDYYLDDLLLESADEEPRLGFAELLRRDLPARNVVASDVAWVNERLARHYGLPPVEGVALRRVALPAGSPRGGFLTQAAVLKVTANGTTTSPVVRGAWILERLLGEVPPPPPAGVPAVEPDLRGVATIREQLERHRADPACATCHAKIDPLGFALEAFDVMGGRRERYRALGGSSPVPGFGKNGHAFQFHEARPVDASGELDGGGSFRDVVELKRLLLRDERRIARNLARQLVVYATGAPVRFGDRAQLEAILDRAAPGGYGVRTLVREIVRSGLFRHK
jgi:hypothetical protein